MVPRETYFMSVEALGGAIREGRLSPVELTEGYLERCRTIGARLNAFVTLTADLALRQARQAEAEIKAGKYRGPLHGIPYAVKDLVAVKGYPTTWGAVPYAHQSFDFDATVVERLNNAGAILLGKAAMIELAGGLGYSSGEASLTGPARNPWNPECWTCGSSSGSGAIVAAGLAPWALGSDTRGSILCPSSWCGVSGMRPSFGRVSRYGSMAIAYSMDKLGPLARTANDCALVLSVLAGHDPLDHDSLSSSAKPFVYQETDPGHGAPLRIGRLTNVYGKSDPGTEKAVDEACTVFEKAGASVESCEFPDGPFEEAAELTILMEAASAFEHLIHSGDCKELVDPVGKVNGYASEQFSVTDYLHVQRVRPMLQRTADSMFDRYSVLISPAQPTAAQPLRAKDPDDPNDPATAKAAKKFHMDRRAPDGVSSLCGLPAISVPSGFSAAGLPYGMQIMGRACNDAAVLRAAKLYQLHTDWHLKHPAL
ncbi:aspartyl-tRNA(Asn)/glutamyl-tRNA(Gln) amidotransferase subunit A [Acidipila rosea]|uniref:Aspartyl-tRNA(Asn)/glutamyl-tRNA(Gln) amidotransferase subunit A n=2 Tax=Acidipila rosea TaxID=768535 RepID=A0A4R1L3Z7_9BACT|nr:aspartyl-tRNA(Asn)/glutamyl-tRNA(Gln) amidotransferase subunit A [Acidipila rosea]